MLRCVLWVEASEQVPIGSRQLWLILGWDPGDSYNAESKGSTAAIFEESRRWIDIYADFKNAMGHAR